MLRVLHLSDLHFGILSKDQQDKHRCKPSAHQFARDNGSQPDDSALAEVVIKDLALRDPPDLVIVSGDLGWSGAALDYVHVSAFLSRLRDTWRKCEIVLAPGNHDVDWSRLAIGTPPIDQSQDAYLDFVQRFYGSQFRGTYKLLEAGPPLNRESLAGFHHGTIRDQSFLVVSVNSAAHIEGNGKGSIYIRPTILRKIDETLQSISADLKIFVLHHHLLPFADPSGSGVYDPSAVPDKPDPTMVANSAKLQTWLAQRAFSLVVHGHKHLSHGRTDVLWKTDSETGRRLFIVGAGSAGVASHERAHGTPLEYNLITLTPLSSTRWQADVAVRQIAEAGAYPEASSHYGYVADLGPPSDAAPVVIHATRANQCHEAIRVRAEGKPMLHNFLSIVDDGKYVDCPTARSDGREISRGEIVRSFEALHPEYEKSERWQKRNQIEPALHDAAPGFQFSHGPRLFGIPEAARKLSDLDSFRPIVRALDNLASGNTSNAYVGLFRPEIDVVSSRNEPLPALVGIQFIPQANNRLDLVATYRKLELAYWWVVNMYEAAELLSWGSSYTKRQPGRITFFAPLAEWKHSPETTFVTTLDKEQLADLVALLMKLANGDADARALLRTMLEEKRQHTNEKNLDPQGLKRIIAILSGIRSGGLETVTLTTLVETLTKALMCIETAMKEHIDDDGLVGKAKEALAAAIDQLQNTKR